MEFIKIIFHKLIFKVLLFSLILCQDFIPNNNSTLNYTQIFFKWPQIINSHSYQLNFNNQDLSQSIEYETNNNSIIIDHFEWDSMYSWSVCGLDESNNIIDCYENMNFSIIQLPANYPENVNILEFNESQYLSGVTLLDYESLGFSVVLDQNANPIWVANNSNFNNSKIWSTQFLSNGNIVGFGPGIGYELNLDSDIVFQTDDSFGVHHQFYKTNNNTYFFIDAEIQFHPCPNECEPEYPDIIPWQGDKFIEIDELGNILWEWSTFDYLTLNEYNPYWVERYMIQWNFGGSPEFDWTHSNSVYFDEEEEIVYVSIRNLSRIVAIDYNTKEILWHIGDSNFMEEVFFDNNFNFSHQHSAQITSDKNIIFFDNGRFNNPEQSRCVEIEVDDSYQNATLVWEHILPESMVSLSRGECDRLSNGNTLITAGRTGNVLELNDQNEILWHLNVTNSLEVPATIYRSERIYNLYPNIFSFQINNLKGEYGNYFISNNIDNSINFTIYNQGWSNQIFKYQFLDEANNLLYESDINIQSNSHEDINLNLDDIYGLIKLNIFSISNPNNNQVIIFNNFILGDTNNDEEINIQDIVVLINLILNDENYIDSGDLNGDGGINIVDIINLIMIIIGF